jgi:hypothetical protein
MAVQVHATAPRLEVLVVASEKDDSLRMQNLEGEQQGADLGVEGGGAEGQSGRARGIGQRSGGRGQAEEERVSQGV